MLRRGEAFFKNNQTTKMKPCVYKLPDEAGHLQTVRLGTILLNDRAVHGSSRQVAGRLP